MRLIFPTQSEFILNATYNVFLQVMGNICRCQVLFSTNLLYKWNISWWQVVQFQKYNCIPKFQFWIVGYVHYPMPYIYIYIFIFTGFSKIIASDIPITKKSRDTWSASPIIWIVHILGDKQKYYLYITSMFQKLFLTMKRTIVSLNKLWS